jgi:peptidoglycan hydrolase CwlO-like protein
MNPSSVSLPEPTSEPASKPTQSRAPRIVLVLLALVVWMLLVAGGFYVGKIYIDRSIEAVQQNNAVHMVTIEQRMDSMDTQLSEIQQAISDADQAWANSGSTQENLNQKIDDLDKQLKALEHSLNILKEAP